MLLDSISDSYSSFVAFDLRRNQILRVDFQVDIKDAVFNMGRIAWLVVAMMKGNTKEMLDGLFTDRMMRNFMTDILGDPNDDSSTAKRDPPCASASGFHVSLLALPTVPTSMTGVLLLHDWNAPPTTALAATRLPLLRDSSL